MEKPKIPIKIYRVQFAVDTVHTEEEIRAYSKTEVKTLLKKRYSNCSISQVEIEEILGGK